MKYVVHIIGHGEPITSEMTAVGSKRDVIETIVRVLGVPPICVAEQIKVKDGGLVVIPGDEHHVEVDYVTNERAQFLVDLNLQQVREYDQGSSTMTVEGALNQTTKYRFGDGEF